MTSKVFKPMFSSTYSFNLVNNVNSEAAEIYFSALNTELETIFKKYKCIPGVTRSETNTEWRRPGDRRHIWLNNNNFASQLLVTLIPGISYSYKIDNFSSFILAPLEEFVCEISFRTVTYKTKNMEYSFKLVFKNCLAKLVFSVLFANQFKKYLKQSAARHRAHIENAS